MNKLKQTNYTEKFFEQGDDNITITNERGKLWKYWKRRMDM